MNGENLGGPAPEATTPAPNPWQALENYKESAPVAPKTETNVASATKNTAERAQNKAESFINNWRARRAELESERIGAEAEANNGKIEGIQSGINEANDHLEDLKFSPQEAEKMSESITSLQQQGDAQKAEMTDLRTQNTIGNYAKTQVNQVEAILKSEANVVKKAVRAFASKIIAKMPRISFSIKTSEKIANENWQKNMQDMGKERQKAKNVVNSAEEAQNQFEAAKEARTNAVAGISKNREDRTKRFERISNLKQEIATNKNNLAEAIIKQQTLKSEYDIAKQRASELKNSLERAKNEQQEIALRKMEVDEKVKAIKERSEKLRKMAEFQRVIGSRSPATMRQNLKGQLEDLENQKQERIEDLLWVKNVDSIDELSQDDAKRLERRMSRYDFQMDSINEQLAALDEYETLRKEQSNRIFNNTTVKKGLRGAVNKILPSLFVSATK